MLFPTAMNCIPDNPLDSSDGGLVHTLDTESCNFIKGASPVLESMIEGSGCRAERLRTYPALVATTISPSSRVEAMANDGSGVTFS